LPFTTGHRLDEFQLVVEAETGAIVVRSLSAQTLCV
jgi:hypothetical protein